MNGTIPRLLSSIQVVARPRQTPLSTAATSGTLYLVATPIGNLDDITVRALNTLRDVSVIEAEDTRRTAKLLRHYDIKTRTRSFHQHNERGETETVLSRLAAGESVAVVTDAGTPLLSDPGAKLVDEALRAGFRVQAIPGPSAVLAALVTSGLAASEFTFVGFPPARSKDRVNWLNNLISEPRPLVIFEAPHRIKRSLADMLEVLGDRQIAVCREMTKIHEELVRGPISEVMEQVLPKGELTIVLSPKPAGLEHGDTVPSLETLISEFGVLTEKAGSRRGAIRELAGRYGLSTRETYQRLEQAKDK
jgi:16S rRNA (cytidine1402-2'-O)-methyltransferase